MKRSDCTSHAVVTICTRNYLYYSKALAVSVSNSNELIDFYVCIIDGKEEDRSNLPLNFNIILGRELEIENWWRFVFQYTAFELSCALKPTLMNYLIDRLGYEKVLYFDSDIQVYGSLKEAFELLDWSAILLCPHLIQALPEDDKTPNETTIAFAGAINGGFVGVRNCAEGLKFLDWWTDKLKHGCIVDPESGVFVDQKWLSLAIVLFDGVHIIRKSGYNVGCWNIANRRIGKVVDCRWMVGNEPLIFFHFSGFSPADPELFSRHENRIGRRIYPELRTLVDEYFSLLKECGLNTYASIKYEPDNLNNDVEVNVAWREMIRLNYPQFQHLQNPFDASEEEIMAFRNFEDRVQFSRIGWRLSEFDRMRKETFELKLERDELNRVLGRLDAHPILGRMWRFWRRWINRDLPSALPSVEE